MSKLRMLSRMLRKGRFMFIISGGDRARYMSRKGLVRGMGENVWFQPRAIADDHALAFQPLQAAQAGRGREVHPCRQLGVGGAPIPLDFSQ